MAELCDVARLNNRRWNAGCGLSWTDPSSSSRSTHLLSSPLTHLSEASVYCPVTHRSRLSRRPALRAASAHEAGSCVQWWYRREDTPTPPRQCWVAPDPATPCHHDDTATTDPALNTETNKKALLLQGNHVMQRVFAYIQWLFECYLHSLQRRCDCETTNK